MGIEILDDFTQNLRLKSARRKKRLQKSDFDKQLIALGKKRSELHKKKHSLGFEPLIPPIQKGWKRTFVLRDDVARSAVGAFYERILQEINTTEYSDRKDFKRKKKHFGRRIYQVRPQTLREFREHEWKSPKLKLTEIERVHFSEVVRWNKNLKDTYSVYVFNEPWRFVLRIRPNIITEKRIVDGDLEQEIKRLSNYIEQNNLQGKIHKLTNGRGYNRWRDAEKEKYANLLINKPLQDILEEFWASSEIISGDTDNGIKR